jgi:hypothetical protein
MFYRVLYYYYYYYLPTCFGRFCDQHQGVMQEYRMKVGSRVTYGKRVSCILTNFGLCTVLNVCLLVCFSDLVETKLIDNGAVFDIQVRTNKQSIA